jgi:TonB family protein
MNSVADSGPNLLLDWHASASSPRWVPAGLGSLLVHILLFMFLFLISRLDTYVPRQATEVVPDFRNATPLIAPPLSELTQKAPNRGKIAKEVNVEDLLPRPASQERLAPAPAVRAFKPPIPIKPGLPESEAPRFAEPPKIEASNNLPQAPVLSAGTIKAPPPPQIQPQEAPKLAFETPGQNGLATDKAQPKLTPPKASVEEALRNSVKPNDQGGIVVGDLDQPLNLPESMRLPPSPGRTGSSLELLSDPLGVDFKPYLTTILALVRRNWFAVIPESARLGNRGVVLLQFIIDRSGQVPKLVIATPSGSESLDRAAVAGISASVPFPRLPSEYKGQQIRLQFAFKYNVK